MPEGKSVETYRGVVHPWLCDDMGHMTTRHYVAMFDDAAWHMLLALGSTPSRSKELMRGWADVRHEIDYAHELRVGELVVVHSTLVRVGGKSITYKLELKNAETGALCATMTSTTVRFDLKARQAVAIEPELREIMERALG